VNSVDARTVPADPESARRLREQGFDYRVVDIADYGSAVAFAQAAERGFLGGAPSDAEIERMRETWAERRNVGVYEADAVPSALPVGTVNSWVASMSLPGGDAPSAIPMWAISMVTVAATHRRRGIARGLLEGELRAAASAGVPMAGLTVTEATIYGRYGFGPAVPVSRIAVDARTSGWRAPQAPGRLEYVGLDELARELGELHERARFARAGQIAGWRGRWLGQAGLGAGSKKDASARGVHYRDVDGVVRGAIAYTLKELPGSFRNSMTIRQLVAETDEALSALWGFAVNHDLVDRIEADLRPVDDPVVRLVANPHAVDVAVRDHGWLRILDVPAALRAPLCGIRRHGDPRRGRVRLRGGDVAAEHRLGRCCRGRGDGCRARRRARRRHAVQCVCRGSAAYPARSRRPGTGRCGGRHGSGTRPARRPGTHAQHLVLISPTVLPSRSGRVPTQSGHSSRARVARWFRCPRAWLS
jgi:GNAT superfamily N-acetyltransferase